MAGSTSYGGFTRIRFVGLAQMDGTSLSRLVGHPCRVTFTLEVVGWGVKKTECRGLFNVRTEGDFTFRAPRFRSSGRAKFARGSKTRPRKIREKRERRKKFYRCFGPARGCIRDVFRVDRKL